MNEFKETEIGLIPEEWEVVPFPDAILKERVRVGKVKRQEYKALGTFPIIDQGQNHIAGYWNNPNDVYQGSLPIIIFGDHTRIFKLVTFPFVCGADGTKVLIPDYRVFEPSFLFYAMLNLKIPSRGYNRHFPILKEQKLPRPPLPEQKKIAAVLSAGQEAKEKTEAVIKATKELKKSLMKHLFTYGPVPLQEAEKVRLKETEIGPVPEEWDLVRLGDAIEKTRQKDPRTNPDVIFKYIDVSSVDREILKIVEYKAYRGKDAPSRARKLVQKADVIVATVRPTLKRLALIDERFHEEICSTAFCVLRAKKEVLSPRYLFYAVARDQFVAELGKIQTGASYPAVTDSDVKGQKIPSPSLVLQEKIADILSLVDSKIEAEENKKKALEDLFRTLLNNIMTGKVRVNHLEIDV